MNPIEYLKAKGFRVTSDPTTYRESYPDGPKSPWGYRNYWEWHNGKKIYHDDYCDGWHRAYDLSDKEGADVYAVVDGTIVAGTGSKENFGGTIVLSDHKGDYQYIYGHCKNLQVEVGDTVKQGQKLAEQSNTNYYNNPMSSHLHFQVQKQGYIPNEKDFVCTGINPLSIDVNNYTEKGNDNVGYAFENLPQLVDMRGKLAESTRWRAPRFKIPYKDLERAVHHSATLSTLAGSTTEAFARFHVNSHDWPCIAYKFSIEPHNIIDTPNGPRAVIHYNHSLDVVGYHVGNSNDLAIGIVIAGDYTKEELTDAAMASFADLNNALDQDNIAMGGMFPHSAYPGYAWKKCSVYSPKYALATGEKLIGESSSIEVGEGKEEEAVPETYVVQQGDTLYSIAATEDFSADDLASWNGIADPTTLKIGQVLELREAKGAAKEKATPYTIGDWETNEYGTQYIKAKGTFTVGGTRIMSREGSPFDSAPEGGWAYPGYQIKYDELVRVKEGPRKGHVEIGYNQNGKRWYLPYNTWDPLTGAVGEEAWGTFS